MDMGTDGHGCRCDRKSNGRSESVTGRVIVTVRVCAWGGEGRGPQTAALPTATPDTSFTGRRYSVCCKSMRGNPQPMHMSATHVHEI
eukprot:194445-Chlamydomonas_euryale.AAC.1